MSTTIVAPEETHESKVLYNQAMEMVNRRNFQTAIGLLEEALQIAPNNAAYLSHYGLCVAMDRNDFDAARKLCERAIEINTRDPINRVNLARVYRLEGLNGQAHDTLLDAWKQDKSHPAAATELSRMGIRRPPVLGFLPRGHWINIRLGRLRTRLSRVSI